MTYLYYVALRRKWATRDTDVLLRIVFSIILILTIYFWRRVLKKNEGLGA